MALAAQYEQFVQIRRGIASNNFPSEAGEFVQYLRAIFPSGKKGEARWGKINE